MLAIQIIKEVQKKFLEEYLKEFPEESWKEFPKGSGKKFLEESWRSIRWNFGRSPGRKSLAIPEVVPEKNLEEVLAGISRKILKEY